MKNRTPRSTRSYVITYTAAGRAITRLTRFGIDRRTAAAAVAAAAGGSIVELAAGTIELVVSCTAAGAVQIAVSASGATSAVINRGEVA